MNGKMLVDSVGKSWPNMDTDLADARFGHDWLMGCGTSNALTTQILRDPLNLGYDWKNIAQGRYVKALIQDMTGALTPLQHRPRLREGRRQPLGRRRDRR